MQKVQTKYLNQKGLTLIESLLSLLLFSIIGTVVYFVLLNGLTTEKKIYTETLIRDEADLVMSQIIDNLYTATYTKVKAVTGQQNMLIYQIDNNTSRTVGFLNNQPVVNGQSISTNEFNFNNSSITLKDDSVIISLVVASKKNANAKPLELKSQFRLMEE
ncbi:prepilin-type N-terminal cleavage/methylation domain-containing protein [Fictibacillus sp. 26RED30]|uniref:prepilin-type N-terminal cleavage/methylation domain-containing protein n=1 Tax=Fictibacillus sp. 26RED30 TaxID=2745877 RepID=UPI0018CF553A|nr:prepilin-type N-terminal cleavage/methylation domain-containing protein [Fictibacillus sp. 26RED30]MBH0159162.1 prepilin-type N-terminal cleavage/methylation domain-containing protein [Fictibacillus sp. 26RED30]